MKRFFVYMLFALFSLCVNAQSGKTITMGTLLDEMVSVEEGARWPLHEYRCLQSSSYDRRSVSPSQPGWFANDDGYGVMRVDTTRYGLERVMLDTDGPGAITRFWITAIDKHGTIRMYFDNEEEPSVTIPSYDLMNIGVDGMVGGLLLPHTSYEKDGRGGSTLFLPIPYQKHCKVTFTYKEGDELTPRYYQLNYRQYKKGTKVETFSRSQVARYQEKINEASRWLQNPCLPDGLVESTDVTELSSSCGESCGIALPEGTNAIYELQIELQNVAPEDYAQRMRDIRMMLAFDGYATESIPLSDFACAGMGAREVKSYYMDCDGKGKITSRWFMPYRKSAVVMFSDVSKDDIKVSVKTKPIKWDKRMLYFHAAWHQQKDVPLTTFDISDEKAVDWNMVNISGRGVYKADMLTLYNYTRAWYGEGDEKIYVDGEPFPSHFGTGTEDYYNCSWAPVVVFQTPFGGAPREDIGCSLGYNTFFRTRHLDGIPFEKSLKFDLEMLGWQNGKADVAATTIWYGDLNSKDASDFHNDIYYVLPPVPADPSSWHRPGAIEFENYEIENRPEGLLTEKQNMLNWQDGQWSGATQYFCINGKPGQQYNFAIPAADVAEHKLSVLATKAPDYGIVSISVNGGEGIVFNGYSNKVELSDAISLGDVVPDDGKYNITITIIDTDGRSVGARYMWGLDCLIVE